MRWSTFVKSQPAQPVSDDPADVFEHGVAPRHRLTSPLHTLQRGQLAPEGFGGILVRLPRRLSKIVAEDAHRWVRGETPVSVEPAPSATRWGTRYEWERAYPGRGLGLPKPLPRRQRGLPVTTRSRLHDAFSMELGRLGLDASDALNTAARQRLLTGMQGELARVVDQTVPGAELSNVRIDEAGVVHGSIRLPPDIMRSVVIRCVVTEAGAVERFDFTRPPPGHEFDRNHPGFVRQRGGKLRPLADAWARWKSKRFPPGAIEVHGNDEARALAWAKYEAELRG
jgi:hypothetical protein